MSVRNALMVAAAFGLAACANPSAEAEKESFLTAKEDAVNVEFTNKAVAESVVGFRAVSISTVLKKAGAQGSGNSQGGAPDTANADCKLASNGYSASFETPAVVSMPSFGRTTSPAKLTCTYNDKAFNKTYKAANLSQSKRTGNALGVGVVLCPICGVVMAVGNSGEKEGDAFGFEPMILEVR